MEAPAEKFMDELRTVIADAEELLRATAGDVGPKVQEVRERAEESLRAARARMQEAGHAAEARAREAAREVDQQVHENPWTAVGVATGVGLIVGILLGRR